MDIFKVAGATLSVLLWIKLIIRKLRKYKYKASDIMKKNRKVTVNSVTINFRNYGEITIPKGCLLYTSRCV